MRPQSTRSSPSRKRFLIRRGMALLLVMIGLVVCTILTAGFLASQGTSIGIARNERDAVKSHAIAQTGIDMCYWLIRNKPDWRQTMSPGNWLTGAPVGDGAVTVTADDGNHNFADDPAAPVTLTATGAFDNRVFALTATICPTGGGTVFQAGNFVNGTILLGNTDLTTIAQIDSYNSATAPYPTSKAGNAAFGTNAGAAGSATIYNPSTFKGSYTAGPTAVLGTVTTLVGGAAAPTAVTKAAETRNPGNVIFPNTAKLDPCPDVSPVNSATPVDLPGPGTYTNVGASNATVNVAKPGTYVINNNLTIGNVAASALTVAPGITASIIVNGNVIINLGKIQLGSNAQLSLYVNGNITVVGGSMNLNGTTSNLRIFGGNNPGTIQLSSGGNIFGAIYAPNHDLVLQTGSPKIYGAAVVKSLTVKNTAQFHFDEALRTLYIPNITGGSAPSGTADYRIAIIGGPGIQR
jgi:Tfp pilus assembly protein PilX